MGIIAAETKSNFKPVPEGLHPAVCGDVVDLDLVETDYGTKHKVKIVWQLDAINPATSKPYLVSCRYTLSLHEKAKLRQHLETWRGRKFTREELKGFDLEKLINANCQVQIIHEPGEDGRIWANVKAVIPQSKHAPTLRVIDYVREKDRQVKKVEESDEGLASDGVDEEPVPF